MTNKQQILEPITSIVKMTLLRFKGDNVKISIRNHGLHYDDPNDAIIPFQHIIDRKIRGDSREDMSVLNDMIVNYLDWYVINNTDRNSRDKFMEIIKYSVEGFKKLQVTYIKQNNNANSNVALVLQYYINLITTILDDIDRYQDRDEFRKCISYIERTEVNIIDIEQVKTIWSEEETNEIYSDLEFCFGNKNTQFVHAKVLGLMDILQKKDNYFKDTIKNCLGTQA